MLWEQQKKNPKIYFLLVFKLLFFYICLRFFSAVIYGYGVCSKWLPYKKYGGHFHYFLLIETNIVFVLFTIYYEMHHFSFILISCLFFLNFLINKLELTHKLKISICFTILITFNLNSSCLYPINLLISLLLNQIRLYLLLYHLI